MLVLLCVAISHSVGAISAISADSRSFSNWESEEASVTVQINPNAFEDPTTTTFETEVAEAYASFAEIFNSMNNEGSAVLSFHQVDQATGVPDAPDSSYAPLGGNSMIVNNNYLDRHTILDDQGNAVELYPAEENVLHLLLPERLHHRKAEIKTLWSESTLTSWDPISGETPNSSFDVVVHAIDDSQEVFNYGDTWKMENWTQSSPVIAVVSPETNFISDYVLLGVAANDGNVIFTDAQEFQDQADSAGLTSRFSGVSTAASHAAERLRDRSSALIIEIGNAVAGFLALLLTTAVLTSIYVNNTRRQSFLKRIHGWVAARIHWPFVATMTIASSIFIAVTGSILATTEHVSGTIVTFVGIAMTLLVLIVTSIAVAVFDSRARSELIKRQ